MLKFFVCFSIIFCSLNSVTAYAESWREIKGDHFIVYYQMDEAMAKQVSLRSEKYYNQIANDLGYPRYSNFWQWENRAKIYIHPSAEAYRKISGQPEWSHGMAKYSSKEIHSFIGSQNFMETLLPHEIAHLIFRDFVGIQGEIPMWLDEGVAQWQEPEKRVQARKYARYLIKINRDLTIQDLNMTNINQEADEEKVFAFYMQAVSVVEFMVTKYGPSSFTTFCRELRDGKKLDAALASAYPNSIAGSITLEIQWRDYVMRGGEQPEDLEVYTKGELR